MSDREAEATTLRELLKRRDSFAELEAFLVANSNLPGPRGNLELAKAFADQVEAYGVSDELLHLLRSWLAIPATDAPTGTAREEFLPFCALQALGAFYSRATDDLRTEIVASIRTGASSARWRVREGAAIAMQRIGLESFSALEAITEAWLPTATLLEQRAILAALAEPPLLRAPGAPRYAFDVCERLLQNVRGLDRATRKSEQFRVLRQALEYGISVVVAAVPEEGFARMRAWAAGDDADIRRILRANLGKARLSKKHGEEVRRVEEIMTIG